MHGTHFAQFSTEVLHRGAAAVLPQHLPDRWLDALLEEADLLAPGEGDAEEGDPGGAAPDAAARGWGSPVCPPIVTLAAGSVECAAVLLTWVNVVSRHKEAHSGPPAASGGKFTVSLLAVHETHKNNY